MTRERFRETKLKAGLFVSLIVFWVMLNGTFALDVLGVGVVVALVITLSFRDGMSFLFQYRIMPASFWASVQFTLYFLKELVAANVRLAAIVLSPSLPIKPGIVKVHTRLKSRVGRLLLANAITLTPGTLTVEMQGEWLFIHWVTIESEDIDGATAKIVSGFERHLEVMYG